MQVDTKGIQLSVNDLILKYEAAVRKGTIWGCLNVAGHINVIICLSGSPLLRCSFLFINHYSTGYEFGVVSIHLWSHWQ